MQSQSLPILHMHTIIVQRLLTLFTGEAGKEGHPQESKSGYLKVTAPSNFPLQSHIGHYRQKCMMTLYGSLSKPLQAGHSPCHNSMAKHAYSHCAIFDCSTAAERGTMPAMHCSMQLWCLLH